MKGIGVREVGTKKNLFYIWDDGTYTVHGERLESLGFKNAKG